MPRFTIKDMLIATTLVAIGVGMFVLLSLNFWTFKVNGEQGLAIALWFGGGAFIGAGLLAPFKRTGTGALVAIVLQVMFMAVALLA